MTTILFCTEEGALPDIEIGDAALIGVEDLCEAPRQIVSLVSDDEKELVLAVHGDRLQLGALQAAARRLGFDPLSLGLLDLGSVAEGDDLLRAVAATRARLSRFPGSRPEQVKLLSPDRSTRRGLFSIGIPTYVAAPAIEHEICVAGDGCRVCVSRCPAGALSWDGGVITNDKTSCVACGICVTSCPTGAVVNPIVTPDAIEAEISAAIGYGADLIGIRYRCREALVGSERGWHQVEVPCTGMLTVGWLLAPLVLGAKEVDAVPCDAGGCPLGNDDRLEAAIGDAATVWHVLGFEHDASASIDHQAAPMDGHRLFGHGSTVGAIQLLSTEAPEAMANLEAADVGTVTIDSDVCTACEMCANVCPTDALRSRLEDECVIIDFDPRSCVACGQCVSACPEIESNAITMTRSFDLVDWASGRREIRRESTPSCEVCGQPIAPASMLSRIESILGEDDKATLALIGRRCVNCRGR
ncbi:MAG: 4Fe-4S binding protein [Acidimicrobiia bacterium]